MYSLTDRVRFYESIFGKGILSGNGKNFDVRCPICAPTDSSKKKLSIRTTDDANHCWTCGWKSRSLAPIIRKYGSQEQISIYREIVGGNQIDFRPAVEEKKIELPKDFRLLVDCGDLDPDVKAAWRYVYSRGLSDKDAWFYKLGISDEPRWKRRVIMPSFDSSGGLNYFVARAIDKDKKPKYDNPDVDKNPVVFNEICIDWSKRLVLVEGAFDMVKCPINSTALLGSDLDERHELLNKILLHGTPVSLCLDGDMWDKKTPRIAKKLMEYNIDTLIVDVRPWGDPGSMSKSEFEKALSEAQYMTWNDVFDRKMKRALQVRFSI